MRRAFALALFVSGCHARTEMIVRVAQSGLAVPSDIDSLTLFIRDQATGEEVYRVPTKPLCGTGDCIALPTAITLFPGSSKPHAIVEVEVQALRNGIVVIDDAASFTFADGRDQEMEFVLFRSCLNTNCAASTTRERTCLAGGKCGELTPVPLGGDLRVPDDVDLAPPADLAMGGDLAVSDMDLAVPDLAPDLASTLDLTTPNDFATPHDFTTPLDFTPLADLTGADFASGTPVFDSIAQSQVHPGVSLTWSHFVGAGSNGMLVVAVAVNGGSTVSSVSYDGISLTQRNAQQNSNVYVTVWYLPNPPSGTSDVTVMLSNGGGNAICAESISLFNVKQAAPAVQYNAGNDTGPQATVVSSLGDLVIDAVTANGDAQLTGPGGGQTEVDRVSTGTAASDCLLGLSTMPASDPNTQMKWALGATGIWAIGVTDLPPP
jgi:hypothetical protein